MSDIRTSWNKEINPNTTPKVVAIPATHVAVQARIKPVPVPL
jgi:hypothetical protein